jgi:flagellar FliL protein
MSAAAAEIPEGAPVVKSGKKKLILIGVIVLVVLAIAGGGAAWWLKKRAAHAAALAEEEGGAKAAVEHKVDMSHPPTFLPLEPFVVNLADRDADRYAQIGITLEVESPAFAEQMKGYMPAVRNAILMVIAHKSAKDLLDRSGKEELADEILREAGRPMGIDVDPPMRVREVAAMHASAPEAASAPAMAAASGAAASAPATAPVHVATAASAALDDKPKAHGEASAGPIHHVHFSSFIIQ